MGENFYEKIFNFYFTEFIDSAQVSPPVEGCFQKDADDFGHLLFSQQVRRQTKDFGVIVSPGHIYAHFVVAQGCSDPTHLVSGDRHSYTCAAEEDTPVSFPLCHSLDRWVGKIRVVARFSRIRAEVRRLMP